MRKRKIKVLNNKYITACHIKIMLKNSYINRGAKMQIYKTIIRPVVTYGCESWTLKKEDKKIFHEDLIGKLSEEFTAQ
jgi:hypothetical protein